MTTSMVTRSGREGLIVFFDTAEVDRQKFADAMRLANLEACAPPLPHLGMALRSALMDAIAEFGMRVLGHPVEYKPLSRDLAGFEAIRVVKGVDENSYPKLFTALVDDTGRVVITHNDPVHGFSPSIVWDSPTGLLHGDVGAQAYINHRYQYYLDRLPGTTAGALVRKAIVTHLNGVALSRTGKCYFLPAASVGQYESLRISFAGEELRFGWFRYEVEPMGFEQIVAALRDEISETVSVVQQDLQECNDKGRRMRRDGRELRMADLSSAHSKLESYERALGVSLDELKSAIEHTQGLLAMNALLQHAA